MLQTGTHVCITQEAWSGQQQRLMLRESTPGHLSSLQVTGPHAAPAVVQTQQQQQQHHPPAASLLPPLPSRLSPRLSPRLSCFLRLPFLAGSAMACLGVKLWKGCVPSYVLRAALKVARAWASDSLPSPLRPAGGRAWPRGQWATRAAAAGSLSDIYMWCSAQQIWAGRL